MADWSAIRIALETWIGTVTGLTCYWQKRPKPAHFGDAYAMLSASKPRTLGNDEIITDYDDTQPAGEEIRIYQSGQRQFVFGVQVRTSRQSDDVDALHYTSLIRDRCCLPTADVAFLAADIAFARIIGEADLDVRLDNRDMSVAQLDLMMNAYSLTEGTATGWIETLDDFEFYDVDTPVPVIWTGDIDVGG